MRANRVNEKVIEQLRENCIGELEETPDKLRLISYLGLFYYMLHFSEQGNNALLLKGYSLREGNQVVPETTYPLLDNSLQEEVLTKRLPVRSGLGFFLASLEEENRGILNVGVWNTRHRLLNQSLYGFDLTGSQDRRVTGENFHLERENLGMAGSFCTTELRIAEHEARAFDKYFQSARQLPDVIAWIRDFYPGGMI